MTFSHRNVPAALPLIRAWEEGLVVQNEDSERLYAEDLAGRRFLISKKDAEEEELEPGDMIMFIPGRTTALKIAK